jgi:outer membrane protein
MKTKTLAASALAATMALAAALPASAQAQAAAAGQPFRTGAPIPGVCIISFDVVLGTSAVGKYVASRMNQLGSTVQAELTSEKDAIQKDASALEAQKSSLSQAQYQQRGQALDGRIRDLQRKAELRQRELQATNDKALSTALGYADPIVHDLVAEKNCSVLLNGQAVIAANNAMDISQATVQRLDAKVTQFAFDREHLDQPGAAGATPAGR